MKQSFKKFPVGGDEFTQSLADIILNVCSGLVGYRLLFGARETDASHHCRIIKMDLIFGFLLGSFSIALDWKYFATEDFFD